MQIQCLPSGWQALWDARLPKNRWFYGVRAATIVFAVERRGHQAGRSHAQGYMTCTFDIVCPSSCHAIGLASYLGCSAPKQPSLARD